MPELPPLELLPPLAPVAVSDDPELDDPVPDDDVPDFDDDPLVEPEVPLFEPEPVESLAPPDERSIVDDPPELPPEVLPAPLLCA